MVYVNVILNENSDLVHVLIIFMEKVSGKTYAGLAIVGAALIGAKLYLDKKNKKELMNEV